MSQNQGKHESSGDTFLEINTVSQTNHDLFGSMMIRP
jgi:hypothetical protein